LLLLYKYSKYNETKGCKFYTFKIIYNKLQFYILSSTIKRLRVVYLLHLKSNKKQGHWGKF